MVGNFRTEERAFYKSDFEGPVTRAKLLVRFIEITKPPDNTFVELLTVSVMDDGRIECVFNLFDI